jgi:hypothetical protein
LSSADQKTWFVRAIDLIRTEYVSSEFLANAVSRCPLVQQYGLHQIIMQKSLVLRDIDKSLPLVKAVNVAQRKNRVNGKKLEWVFKTKFALEELLTLKTGEKSRQILLGFANGYAVAVFLQRKAENDAEKEDTLAFSLRLLVAGEIKQGERAYAITFCKMCVHLGNNFFVSSRHLFKLAGPAAVRDFFRRPWSEIVCE